MPSRWAAKASATTSTRNGDAADSLALLFSGLSSPGRAHAHRGEASGCGRHTGRLRCVWPSLPRHPTAHSTALLATSPGWPGCVPASHHLVPTARAEGYRTVDVVMAHLAIVGASRAAYGVPTRDRRSTPIIQPRIAVPRVLELPQRVYPTVPGARARASDAQSAVIVYCVDIRCVAQSAYRVCGACGCYACG